MWKAETYLSVYRLVLVPLVILSEAKDHPVAAPNGDPSVIDQNKFQGARSLKMTGIGGAGGSTGFLALQDGHTISG